MAKEAFKKIEEIELDGFLKFDNLVNLKAGCP